LKLRAIALEFFYCVLVGSAALLFGWLLWRKGAAGDADPFDNGIYWLGALFIAFALGAFSPNILGIFTAAIGLVVAPIGGTFELAEETDSPFGALGIIFVIPFAFVLALAAWGGFALFSRHRW
jgi:hypothetical protein